MSDLKNILLKSGVAIATLSLFFITLPFVIFFSGIMLMTGIAIAVIARYRLAQLTERAASVDTTDSRHGNIIEGHYEVK